MAPSAPAFAPEPPSDLVLPSRGSMTARAVASLALRKLYDWLKSVELEAAEPALGELRAEIAVFLPGRPKVVAALLDAPAVAAPLRSLRAAGGEPSALARAALVAARAHLASAGLPTGARPASFLARDAFVAPTAASYLLSWPAPPSSDLEAFVDALRAGEALLRQALPGVAEALERVARVVVPTADPCGAVRAEPHAPGVIGVGIGRVPDDRATPTELASALAHATARALLLLLRELDPLADDAGFDALATAATATVDARLAEILVQSRGLSLDDGLPRERASEAFRALVPHEPALTPVGRGVFRELARHAGYAEAFDTEGKGEP